MHRVHVAVDVHRGPREREHARLDLALHVLQVRLQQVDGHRHHVLDLLGIGLGLEFGIG